MTSPPGAGSSRTDPAAMAIGATGSATGATGSIAGATGSAIEGWPATDLPATEPPATEPPATEPPATEPPATEPPATEPPATDPPASEPPGGCRLASDGAILAAFWSRICAGSQLVRSAAEGYAADRSVRNWFAVGRRLGSRDRLRFISGRRLSGTLSMFGLPCTTR